MRRFRRWITVLWILALLPSKAFAAEIRMNVLKPDIRSSSVAVTEEHTWFIRCFIPENDCKITVFQTLSSGLTLIPGSIEVCYIHQNGTVYPLAMEEDYTLTAGAVVDDTGIAERFLISITEEGYGRFSQRGELRITYLTKINGSASVGTQLLGTAQLNLLDPEGERTVVVSDKASVTTGGLQIFLTDEAGVPLSGGEFMLAQAATEGEPNTELLDTGTEMIPAVYIPFCQEDLNEKTTYTAITDTDGHARCYGLRYGEYYLVQTKPGKGTELPSKPIKVTVNEVSHLTAEDGWKTGTGVTADYSVKIVNSTYSIPETGDRGIYSCRAALILVILCACMLLWYNRKGRSLFQ